MNILHLCISVHQVEGLLEGEDFAAKVTREEYLNLIKDLLDRVTKPVEDALKASEITWVSVCVCVWGEGVCV